jgi:hypothetical protein
MWKLRRIRTENSADFKMTTALHNTSRSTNESISNARFSCSAESESKAYNLFQMSYNYVHPYNTRANTNAINAGYHAARANDASFKVRKASPLYKKFG